MPQRVLLLALLALAACQPGPPTRADLLARLQAALPASDTDSVGVRTGFATFENEMVAANPGHEADISAILDDYANCISIGLSQAAPALAIAAADASLTDGEIEQLIAFYAGPDRARFVAIEVREENGEVLSAADAAFLARYRDTDAARKFSLAMASAARAFPATDDGRRMIGACTLRMRSAFGQADLTMP
jgi:hypothetical protein